MLGLSFPNEQAEAFAAAADFQPLSPVQLADLRPRSPGHRRQRRLLVEPGWEVIGRVSRLISLPEAPNVIYQFLKFLLLAKQCLFTDRHGWEKQLLNARQPKIWSSVEMPHGIE